MFVKTPEIDLLGWNLKDGGLGNTLPTKDTQPRERLIQRAIKEYRNMGVRAAALSDTRWWDQRYGSDEAITDHLGFKAASFISLEDSSLVRRGVEGMGNVFATDYPVEFIQPLDLDTRQGIQAILKIGHYGVQIAQAYLDDLSEEARRSQIRALLNNIEPDIPTIIIGDLNTPPANMRGASLKTKMKDVGLHASWIIPPLSPTLRYYRQTLSDMNERGVLPLLEQAHFINSDPTHKPTMQKFGSLVAAKLDHALLTPDLQVVRHQVMPARGASDHSAIRVQATFH